MSDPCKILVFASGNGSNFQALIDAVSSGAIPNSKIIRLIVNKSKAYATTRADNAGIPWEYFNLISHGFRQKGETDPAKLQESREKYDAALAEKVLKGDYKPDLVILAGWMYVFGKAFLDPLEAEGIKIINLHPALPGKYDGTNAIGRAFEDFKAGKLEDNKTGIMVHYVIAQVDRGAPILVKEIECREGEELEQLEQRIHSHEHELIVEAAAKVAGEILDKKNKTQ
ncbi:Bifunctional purine biosynthetic protein ADE5,7 [Podospora pseudocomata]|uniref:phosphoribosylglycinamide formyltransferase 1 n=2 Tax=Podospora TaxID=5144 RepID=A0ABY6S321_PODCO|nr:Bifunctional purine biosynthetic protein ADE5,7 [Podospora pseudocomata]VBB75929.1 Putative phosphoribosylglycinamide formyltransferase [Podospora comata]